MALSPSASTLSERLAALLPRYHDARERVEAAGLIADDQDAAVDRFLRLEGQLTAQAYREGVDLGTRPNPHSPVGNVPLRAVADGQNLFIVFGHDPDHEGEVHPEELLVIPIGPLAALLEHVRNQAAPGKTVAGRRRKSSRPRVPVSPRS